MKARNQTGKMVMAAAFTAIIIIMASVPFLGYIPLGFMNATIIHIPVILGSVILGPKYGGFFGLVFGITSMWKATTAPLLTSFVFSPFTNAAIHGVTWKNLVGSTLIPIVPRVLIGIVAYECFCMVMSMGHSKKRKRLISLTCAGVAGSLTNTILVMGLIYLFFGGEYAAAMGKASQTVYTLIIGIVFTNGIPEAIVSGILTCMIGKVLLDLNGFLLYN